MAAARCARTLAALLAAPAFGACTATAQASAARAWSPPALLSACAATGTPRLAFPSDSPAHATGRGALVWSASRGCPGGEGARVAPIGAGDVPGASAIPRTPLAHALALRGALALAGGPHGQIVIAGELPGPPDSVGLIEGSALGPFSPLSPAAPALLAPVALTTAYLGDVALLAPARAAGGAEQLRLEIERHFARSLAPGVRVSVVGSVQALAVALDYRADALAVWRQAGAIYARELPASSAPRAIQRLAPAGAHVRVAALLSDDDHAILAWSEQRAGETSVYLDISAAGVRFGAPQLLERFRDPPGLPSPALSPSLVRLSSESVMMAWAGCANGRWVVRAAAIDLQGPQPISTLAAPDGGQALLAGLAAGPRGEAIVLWTEPQQGEHGEANSARQAIFAARGLDAASGRVLFDAPELVAAPAAISRPSIAFDPGTDRALSVWRSGGGSLEYAIRAAS
jgi:hypothetical protein